MNSNSTSPDLISSQSPGLPTTQNGVTVTVTSGSFTAPCPLYYLSPGQIDAVLPGGTPAGNANITVTNNGVTSASFQVPVVQSAFGILSYNGSLAAAYDANNNIITSANSANPNQVIVLWASDMILTISAIAALGYLGIGIQAPTPEWGVMIADGQQYLLTNWLLATAPGLVIVVLGIGLALISDAMAGRGAR